MKTLLSCAFNMDNCCVELKFANGSMIAIDTIAVENEIVNIPVSESILSGDQETDWQLYMIQEISPM